MATMRIELPVTAFIPASTNGAAFRTVDGSAFPVQSLAFDASTAESAFVQLQLLNYGSGNISCIVDWYADSASSGDVVFGASIAAITPNTDSQDVETDALATENTVTDSHLGTTGQRVHSCTVTISNLDSVATGDDVWLRLRRVAADGADTMTGDAQVLGVRLEYSDA